MAGFSEHAAPYGFKFGLYMTRRLVRAWQLKVPSTYLPPGASKHEIRPEGTWVLEDLKVRKRRKPSKRTGDDPRADASQTRQDGKQQAADAPSASQTNRHARWAVDAELFPKKYRQLKGNLYLNVEHIHLSKVQNHNQVHPEHYVPPGVTNGPYFLRTREALQQVEDHQLIATGQSGDIWPIDAERVRNREYRRVTLYNRIALSLTLQRLCHMALRLLGILLLASASLASIAGALAVVDRVLDLPDLSSPTLARCLTLLLLLLPAVGRCGLALAFPNSKPPTTLSLLMFTAASVVIFSILIGFRIGNGPIHSLHTAMRQLTGGTYDEALTGSVETLAQSTAFLGTLIVTISFIMVGRIVFRHAWDLALTRILTFDLIVIGLGTSTIRLLQDIRSSRILDDITKRVVVIDNTPANPKAATARSLGAFVIFSDLDEHLLRRLATSPARSGWHITYKWQTEFVLAYTTDTITNLRVAELVDRLKEKFRPTDNNNDRHVVVSIRVEDLWTRERYLTNPITGTDTRTQLAVINSFETCAADAVETIELRQLTDELVNLTGPIVLVGYSQLAVAFIRHLRQRFLMAKKLMDKRPTHLGDSPILDASMVDWSNVHWVSQTGAVHVASELLPCDIIWTTDDKQADSEFHVVLHDEREVDCQDLIASLNSSVILFFGVDAMTNWVRLIPMEDALASIRSPLIYIECTSSRRYQFDQGQGHWYSGLVNGPRPMVTEDGLVRPGYHLHGHVGIAAELIHTCYSYGLDRERWRSEFLNPIHRKSTFESVQLVLEKFHQRGYVLRRVAQKELSMISEDIWAEIEEAEHERWLVERKKLEPNRGDLVPWKDASDKQRQRTRDAVRLVQEVLFMVGLDFVERS